MTDTGNDQLQEANEKLKAEIAANEALRRDMWAHEVFRRALRKIGTTLAVFLIIVGGVGAVTVFDLVELHNYITETVRQDIDKNVEEKIVEEMDKNNVDKVINAKIEEFTKAKTEEANAKIGVMVEDVSRKVAEVELRLKDLDKGADDADKILADLTKLKGDMDKLNIEAADASKALRQVTIAYEQARDETQPKYVDANVAPDGSNVVAASTCPEPNEADRELLAVRHISTSTGTLTPEIRGNTYPISKQQTFVEIGQDESIDASRAACIFSWIDRVVYDLDPRWFQPAEVVSVNSSNKFELVTTTYGGPMFEAHIYVKNDPTPVKFSGKLWLGDNDKWMKRIE